MPSPRGGPAGDQAAGHQTRAKRQTARGPPTGCGPPPGACSPPRCGPSPRPSFQRRAPGPVGRRSTGEARDVLAQTAQAPLSDFRTLANRQLNPGEHLGHPSTRCSGNQVFRRCPWRIQASEKESFPVGEEWRRGTLSCEVNQGGGKLHSRSMKQRPVRDKSPLSQLPA